MEQEEKTRWQPPPSTEFMEVENWRPVVSHPDYEVSDMGRVRCLKDRRGGHKAPFFIKAALTNSGRPVVTLRNEDGQKAHRVDELVLEAFLGPRPGPDWGAVPTNGDRRDVRSDNLSWVAGIVKPANRIGVRRPKKKVVKKQPEVKLPKEIRHGHWLGTGNVTASIQPNGVIELTVADAQDYHSIPLGDLDDVIRILQAARSIIDG